MSFLLFALVPHASAQEACHLAGNSGYTLISGGAAVNHLNQHADDFLWTVAWDDQCEPVDLWAACSQAYGPLQTYTYEWVNGGPAATSVTAIPCAAPHTIEPSVESHVLCQQGSAAAPYYHEYYRDPVVSPSGPVLGNPYGAVCDYAGKEIELGPSGGPVQLECDTQTQLTPRFFRWGLFTGLPTPVPGQPCTGTVSNPLSFYQASLATFIPGYVECPASGALRYHFTDYGPAVATLTHTYGCTPGDRIALSDLPW
ncbi:MAG: hypothetical protein H6737_28635 [Alphaproteobacteria bacterium]|nr:hypothetical protein [Alphaproteobacteria bacterium]